MAKTKTQAVTDGEAVSTAAPEAVPAAEPATGTQESPLYITAATREEIFDRVEALKQQLEPGRTVTAGTVGQRDDGLFSIRIDFI